MEIIVAFLKQLGSSLDTSQFLFILGVIVVAVWLIVNFLFKHVKDGKFLGLFGNSETHEINLMKEKMTTEFFAQTEAGDRLLAVIEQIRDETREHHHAVKSQLNDYALLKKDLDNIALSIKNDLDEVKHQFANHDMKDQQLFGNLRDTLARLLENANAISAQIKTVDETLKSAVPEFRADHKDLNRLLTELNRDVALLERSIQTQLSASSSVKLR